MLQNVIALLKATFPNIGIAITCVKDEVQKPDFPNYEEYTAKATVSVIYCGNLIEGSSTYALSYPQGKKPHPELGNMAFIHFKNAANRLLDKLSSNLSHTDTYKQIDLLARHFQHNENWRGTLANEKYGDGN